jgi:hypothetical protein
MSRGLFFWVTFFVLWLLALQRATGHALKVESLQLRGTTFQPGTVNASTIMFHVCLTTLLCVIVIVIVYENPAVLWFGGPSVLATIVQGAMILPYRGFSEAARTRRISPYWITEQWPLALLGLSTSAAGFVWYFLSANAYPLLLVGYSAFFLYAFAFYFEHSNGIRITPTTFQYVRSFPRLRAYVHRRPRSKELGLTIRRRRRGIYKLRIREPHQSDIELTASLSSRQRLTLELEEYFIRTDQA